MARHTIALAALAARTAALSGLDRRAAMRWSAGAGAGLVAEQALAADAPAAKAPAKLFDVTLPFKGKDVPLSKFRGDAHLVVNIKIKTTRHQFLSMGNLIWCFYQSVQFRSQSIKIAMIFSQNK